MEHLLFSLDISVGVVLVDQTKLLFGFSKGLLRFILQRVGSSLDCGAIAPIRL